MKREASRRVRTDCVGEWGHEQGRCNAKREDRGIVEEPVA